MSTYYSNFSWYGGALGEYFAAAGLRTRAYYRKDGREYGISLKNPRAATLELIYQKSTLTSEGRVLMKYEPHSLEKIEQEIEARPRILAAARYAHFFKYLFQFGADADRVIKKNLTQWHFLKKLNYIPIILVRRNKFAQLFSQVVLFGTRNMSAATDVPIHHYAGEDPTIKAQRVVYQKVVLKRLVLCDRLAILAKEKFPQAKTLFYEDDVSGKTPQHIVTKLGYSNLENSKVAQALSVKNRYVGHPGDYIVNYDEMIADFDATNLGGRKEFEESFG